MRPMLILAPCVLAATLVAALAPSTARAVEPEKPAEKPAEKLEKIDRMRVVGRPVLDQAAKEGVYVWLEDGWYHLAAVTDLPFGTKKKTVRTFYISVASTKPIKAGVKDLEEFKRNGGGESSLDLRVTVGPRAEVGKFETEGDITVSEVRVAGSNERVPIYIGPLARPGAATVRIGRY